MELFGIAIHAHVDATCIDPSTAILARGDVVEIAHDVVAQIVLQVLSRTWVAGFCTCPETIEIEGLFLKVESESVEMVVPVGIFDDDLHLWIDRLGRIHYEFAPSISHEPESVLCPALAALLLRGNLIIVLQINEEEVVEDEVIEVLGGVFRNLLDLLALVLTGIAVGLEVSGL